MQESFKKVSSLLAFGLFSMSLISQVIINEYCAANYNDWTPEEDWVEFYNPTGAAISLEGYFLSDNMDNVTKWEFPANASVPANGHLVVLASGEGEFNINAWGYLNTNFKLTQTGNEEIVFSAPDESLIEMYEFNVVGPNQANQSWGRSSDGAADWVIFTNPSPDNSNGGASGTAYAARPEMDFESGYYGAALSVTLSTPEAGASIYYTLNGSTPNDGSTLYTGPININSTTVIRAISYNPDANILPSFIETNTYFTGDDNHTLPVVSISGTTLDGGWNGNEDTAIEFFDENGDFICEAHGDSNEHGNDSNAYDQRGFDYICRDQKGYAHAVETQVFPQKSRDKFQRLIFKAAANDNYSFEDGGCHMRDAYVHELSQLGELHMDERTTLFCIVYINGEYWGVYDVREKVDDLDFTDYYSNQPRGYVDFMKTWGGTWEEFGSGDDWYDLVDFALANDMTDDANYQYVIDQLNHMSMIDYFILNSYIVTMDWLNWNTAWWRGRHPDGDHKKWRYVLWDMDASFGHYVNYTGIPDTSPEADPCNPEGLGDTGGQGHVPLLNALFENENFQADYINRYADLSNSIFSCEYMVGLVDSMKNVIAPEMERQCQRWPGWVGASYAGWESNVDDWIEWIEARCSDEIISGMEDCYDIEAVTITIIIDGVGEVQISTIVIDGSMVPWDGIYYAELPIELQALVDMGIFIGWEVTSGDLVIDDPTNPNIEISVTGDVTIVAHFVNDLDPQLVEFDVQPVGAGDILIDGNAVGPYPNTMLVSGGVHAIEATENEWFTFSHWETQNLNINPDTTAIEGSVFVTTTDTIIAVFDETPHFEIIVDVEPAGAGTISIDGVDLASYPFVDVVEGGIDMNFVTIPADEWSTFSHWEVNNAVINPDELSLDIILNFNDDDEIIAVYDVYPHFTITVLVDPPYMGSVLLPGDIVVMDEHTQEFAGDTWTPMLATPVEYWDFEGWKSSHHVPTPDLASRQVSFNFTSNDTIVAHFIPQDFSMYIPNSFTPNADGMNDVFKPIGYAIDIEEYSLQIFNRWGNMVFETDDPEKVWTGEHAGGDYYVEDETYVYILKVKSVHDTEEQEFMGHITVFR